MLGRLNAGDRRTLTAAALGRPAQFNDVEAAPLNLASALAAVATQAVDTSVARGHRLLQRHRGGRRGGHRLRPPEH